jgi:3-isopropylmalate/(R)-2-methylmalate dehydratase small subunit
MTVTAPSGKRYSFDVEPARREALLAGLDEIGITLRRAAEIAAFQAMTAGTGPGFTRSSRPVLEGCRPGLTPL